MFKKRPIADADCSDSMFTHHRPNRWLLIITKTADAGGSEERDENVFFRQKHGNNISQVVGKIWLVRKFINERKSD